MRRGKKYREKLAGIDRSKAYELREALQTVKDLPSANFDETVEIAFHLGVDTRKSDQMVRGALVLPQGTGQPVRVAVIAEGDPAQAAQDAGADYVGSDDLVDSIQNGWMDFDVLIATPDSMKSVRKLGRVLGPRGLMPNPKTGTVTDDVGTAVKESKAGRVEYRTDRVGCVHVPIGRKSFQVPALEENANAVTKAVTQAKPSTVRGSYIRSVAVCTTMSPAVKLDVREIARV